MALQSVLSSPWRIALAGSAALYLGYRAISALRPSPLPPAGAVVLVTGCDSGIGNATAKLLASREDGGVKRYKVLAGCFTEAGVEELGALGPNVVPFRLDVASDESVAEMRKIAERECGEQGLFAVFNIAGIFSGTYNDLTPVSEWKRVFDVNVFGMIRVTQAVYHLVHLAARHARLSAARGAPVLRPRIVCVTSVASEISTAGTLLPASGAYSASKHAARSFASSLRCEAVQFGIDVVDVRPFFTGTNLFPDEQGAEKALRGPITKGFGEPEPDGWKTDPTGARHPAHRYRGGLDGLAENGTRLYRGVLGSAFKPAAEVAARMVAEAESARPARSIVTLSTLRERVIYYVNKYAPETAMALFEAGAGAHMAPLLPEKKELEGGLGVRVGQAAGEREMVAA
ncbi:hypothetical protein DFJ74DRAFT_775722 [Hyaloraphidium curvatum]|nr:hypothetical protein DFJ74DRAFT_775722 [Hyaloraphidium curvatum]